jgi:ribose 1,5-bisphosphokinase PhnN
MLLHFFCELLTSNKSSIKCTQFNVIHSNKNGLTYCLGLFIYQKLMVGYRIITNVYYAVCMTAHNEYHRKNPCCSHEYST